MKDNPKPVIDIRNLVFSIAGNRILSDISCSFSSGKIHGLVGPNGSGKSTLLRNICRIWTPQAGSIIINDTDYTRINRRRLSSLVTLVPQNTQANFSLTVHDFVAMGRHPHLRGLQSLAKADKDIVHNSLKKTKTLELSNRFINEISGGEAQLASIARALATEAPLILLDEPTSALDINHKLEIMDLLCELKKEDKTIIISIHDLELARRYADTITMLHQGKVFFNGEPSKAFNLEMIEEVFHVSVQELQTAYGICLLFYR